MPDAAEQLAQQRALEDYFRRALKRGTLSQTDIEGYQADAAAALISGTTIIELTVEGGLTRAQVNCPPQVVSNAVEKILSEIDPTNDLANTSLSQRYADFSGGRIEP